MGEYINWNNTISYIKSMLGAEVNQLEVDEYDIVDIIKTKTMPVFCSYINFEDYINSDNLAWISDPRPRPMLVINNYPRQIYEIKNVYMPRNVAAASFIPYSATEITSAVIENYTYSIAQSMVPIRSWTFIRPDKIELHFPLSSSVTNVTDFLIHVGAEFLTPQEIEPSMYIQFRKLATADVIEHIVALRTKYQSLTTPQGQINMDVSRLEQTAQQLRQEALTVLQEQTIPDQYLWWVNP